VFTKRFCDIDTIISAISRLALFDMRLPAKVCFFFKVQRVFYFEVATPTQNYPIYLTFFLR
jgi:hypothetical protein